MHPFTFTILYLLVDLSYSYPDDVVCYRKWYFNSPRPAPRRCPPSDFFSYYECCGDSDACCRRVRVELLIFLFVPLAVLTTVLCCCTIMAIFRRQKQPAANVAPQLSRDERECHYFY